jgi:formylglycine-generating enzyme required for sulfatase activity
MEAVFAAGIVLTVRADWAPGGDQGERFHGTKAGQVREDNGLAMKLVWCPPGTFKMGSPKEEDGRGEDETQVDVKLTGFWLGRHEVTQSEWQRVMKTTPWAGEESVKEGPNYPASWVSWEDAMRFCGQLNAAEQRAGRLSAGWRYALPTEAQWEYACRAGTKSRFAFGDREADLGKYAWFKENTEAVGEDYPHEVGLKMPNLWGLYDMNGNVVEWCRDYYVDRVPGGADPEVRAYRTIFRVIRGGGQSSLSGECRAASRWAAAYVQRVSMGFRVALVPPALSRK